MKYGTDQIKLDAAESDLLQAISRQPNTSWYAWLDSAFDVADELQTPIADKSINIYQLKEMTDMQHLGPRLVQVFAPGDDVKQIQTQLRPWLTHASGRPMLSLWASDQSAHTLAQHLQAWSWAYTPDQEAVLLRLADTRSACSLQQTLQPAQWHGLTAPLRQWLYISRQGEIAALPVGPTRDAPNNAAAQPPLVLDDEQIQTMAYAAEADALLHHIATQTPEVIPDGVLPSTMHSYTVLICELAQQYEIDHFADKMTLLISACITNGEVLKSKVNLNLLVSKQYPKGQLAQHWPAKS
jgi:Domain of unknown function (DUF4123)